MPAEINYEYTIQEKRGEKFVMAHNLWDNCENFICVYKL